MSDPQNTRGVPEGDEEADTASGGAPERMDAAERTDASEPRSDDTKHGTVDDADHPPVD